MIVYFPIFKIYVTLCLIGKVKKSIIQLKPTRQYPVPVVTTCVVTAEPVKYEVIPAGLDTSAAQCLGKNQNQGVSRLRTIRPQDYNETTHASGKSYDGTYLY